MQHSHVYWNHAKFCPKFAEIDANLTAENFSIALRSSWRASSAYCRVAPLIVKKTIESERIFAELGCSFVLDILLRRAYSLLTCMNGVCGRYKAARASQT